MGSFRLEQMRAIVSVQRLTGLPLEQASLVVVDGRHDLYDAERVTEPDVGETLGDEVCAAIDDHLDTANPAGAFVVVSLLEAVGGPWLKVYGETLELALANDRRALTGSGYWSQLEIPAGEGEYEFWWTGIAADCPDPLLVADVLEEIVAANEPVAGRRVSSVEGLLPRCHRCGAVVVPVAYGMPDEHLRTMERLGYAQTGGCVVFETEPPGPETGVCLQCGQSRLLTLAGMREPGGRSAPTPTYRRLALEDPRAPQ